MALIALCHQSANWSLGKNRVCHLSTSAAGWLLKFSQDGAGWGFVLVTRGEQLQGNVSAQKAEPAPAPVLEEFCVWTEKSQEPRPS